MLWLTSKLSLTLTSWRAVDIFSALYLCVFNVLILLLYERTNSPVQLVFANCLAIVAIGLSRRMAIATCRRSLRFLLNAFPLIVFFWIYKESGAMIHAMTDNWFDDSITNAEFAVFGTHLSLWCEQFIYPWLTEAMMFAYFSYIPLLPIACAILFFKISPDTMDRFLTSLTLGYGVCFLSFIILPVEGPRHTFAGNYALELEGFFFRWLTGFVERYGQIPGGCFPSPHCTAGTVMLFALWTHRSAAFYVILPVVILFFVSTVYGRYHYISDVLAGVVVATVVFILEPHVERWWQTFRGVHMKSGDCSSENPAG